MDFYELSRDHRKLLKKAARHGVIRTDESQITDVEYLREHKFIDVCSCDKPDDFYYEAKISERGKAYLSGYREHRTEMTITQIIAALALLLSLIATFTPLPDWIQGVIEGSLKL